MARLKEVSDTAEQELIEQTDQQFSGQDLSVSAFKIIDGDNGQYAFLQFRYVDKPIDPDLQEYPYYLTTSAKMLMDLLAGVTANDCPFEVKLTAKYRTDGAVHYWKVD